MTDSLWFRIGAGALAVGILVIGWRLGKKYRKPIEDEDLHMGH